jgi:hypothetical protein
MVLRNIGIIVLGLGAMAGMARGSTTYQGSQLTFASQATTTDGLTLSSLITFTGTLTELAGTSVPGDEYLDPTTGVEFLAFNGAGMANVAFASVSGGKLSTQNGDAIEVIFPSGVDYGFAFNFTTAYSFETLCVDASPASFPSCAGSAFITSGNSGFIGALNDNPTPAAPLVSLWLHPQSAGPDTDLQSFEVATQAAGPPAVPETRTMLLIGSGLILIHQLRRRQKKNGTALPQAADRFA